MEVTYLSKIIMGIELEQRRETATDVQVILTDYGCSIKTRLGLHQDTNNNESCSEKGLILLEFIANADKDAAEMESKLSKISGVVVKKIVF